MNKAYKPLTEPLNTFVEETKVDRKKVLEENRNIPKKLTLEDKPPLLAIDKNLIETVNLGEIAVKYLSNAIKKNGYTQHMVWNLLKDLINSNLGIKKLMHWEIILGLMANFMNWAKKSGNCSL